MLSGEINAVSPRVQMPLCLAELGELIRVSQIIDALRAKSDTGQVF